MTGCCESREGGKSVWLGAGEEDAELVSQQNLLKNMFSFLALEQLVCWRKRERPDHDLPCREQVVQRSRMFYSLSWSS